MFEPVEEVFGEPYPDLESRLIGLGGDSGPMEGGPFGRFDEENQERRLIDVERLFDPRSQPWLFEPTEEDLAEIDKAFAQGEPTENETGATQGGWPLVWETCAWYQPIHFFGPDWGIYIKEDCVRRAAYRFARFVPRHVQPLFSHRDWLNRLSLAALLAYYYHEHYHHRVESLGYRLHVVLGRSCYRPYMTSIYQVLKTNLGYYPAGPYINGWNPDEQIEEALANANSYRHTHLRGSLRAKVSEPAIRAWQRGMLWQFRHDPPGYRQAHRYLLPREFRAGENILKERMVSALLAPGPAPKWDFTPDMTKGFFERRAKFWGVIDRGGRWRFPVI